MSSTEYRSWRVAFRDLSRALDHAVAQRKTREHAVVISDGIYAMAWTLFEREQMTAAVNALRTRWDLPPVSPDDVAMADDIASGHVNWHDKFAASCANLAVGRPINTH